MLPVDIDFSADDGWAESRYVYLEGNDLPQAWGLRREFVVSELGFGTGLNLVALAALAARQKQAGSLVPRILFQTVEWAPRSVEQLQALALRWPELGPFVHALVEVYRPVEGWNRWVWPWGDIVLFVGDARTLPQQDVSFASADVWFLDGYAPERSFDLWEPELLRWVARRTVPGGTATTYSAAGTVKRGLRDAGFEVKRRAGWGNKRHMVVAKLPLA